MAGRHLLFNPARSLVEELRVSHRVAVTVSDLLRRLYGRAEGVDRRAKVAHNGSQCRPTSTGIGKRPEHLRSTDMVALLTIRQISGRRPHSQLVRWRFVRSRKCPEHGASGRQLSAQSGRLVPVFHSWLPKHRAPQGGGRVQSVRSTG